MKIKKLKILFLTCCLALSLCVPTYSFDLNSSINSVNAQSKNLQEIKDLQDLESFLTRFENDWNNHNHDSVFRYYSDRFVNGDGLNLENVKKLTSELWDAYPDIMTKTLEKKIRVSGDYATIESTDSYIGMSKLERNDVGTEGTLKATSTGKFFLKRYGKTWQITSDKTHFEEVGIGYGVGADLLEGNKVKLTAPEQVISDQRYAASLKFNLGDRLKPIASIGKEILIYPQKNQEDKFRLVDKNKLERLFLANKINKNELITATVGLTGGPLQPKLLGLIFLTKRVNVIPLSEKTKEEIVTSESAKSALGKSLDITDFDFYDTFIKNTPDE